ncbi:MAG: ATPase domain-containing protein [Nitrososphaerota archaeon]
MSSHEVVLTGVEGFDKIITGFPRGGLITVSGNPGTGKTALAGAFIYNGILKYNEPGVYASLLEDEERFYDFMLGFGLDFRSLRDRGLFKYLAIPTLFEPGVSISVADIVDAVESMSAKRLVIDSFTAMSQMFKSPFEARVFLHSLLSKIARQMGCTTILIKEIPNEQVYEYGFEEFISDGVIFLKREIIEDRLWREVNILKMRGSEIREPLACISLYKGFEAYPPLNITKEFYEGRKYVTPPDLPGRFSTGISDLDKEIGGFTGGTTILLEIDPHVSLQEYALVYSPMLVSNIIRGNRPVIMILSGGTDWRDVINFAKIFKIPEELINDNLTILIDIERKEELPQNVEKMSMFDPEEVFERIFGVVERSLSAGKGPPIISLGIDRLASRLREAIVELIYRISNLVRNIGGLTILLAKPLYPWIIERLAPLSDSHIKITKKHGRVILYGVKPRTRFFIVEPSEEDLIPRLIPVI